jgi:hypothetical protein
MMPHLRRVDDGSLPEPGHLSPLDAGPAGPLGSQILGAHRTVECDRPSAEPTIQEGQNGAPFSAGPTHQVERR